MAAYDEGLLEKYNSLTDKNLMTYFSNNRMRRHLVKNGLIKKNGEVISDSAYRVRLARKEHRSRVQRLIGQTIMHKAFEMERSRQIDIDKKIEEIAKVELVRRIRSDSNRLENEEGFAYFNAEDIKLRSWSAKERTKSVKSQSDNDEFKLPSTPDSRHRWQTILPNEEYEAKHLSKLDSLTLGEYAKILEKRGTCRLNKLPRLGHKSPRNRKSSQSGKNHLSNKSQQIESTRSSQNKSQSNTFLSILFHAPANNRSFDVMVEQQPNGANTIILYKETITNKYVFQLKSHRHKGFPFSLTFYIDNVKDSRISTCCEYKHKIGKRIGGPTGHFTLFAIDGDDPCFKCLAERDLLNEKKQKRNKDVKYIEQASSRHETISVRSASEDHYKSSDEFESESNSSKNGSESEEDKKVSSAQSRSSNSIDRGKTPEIEINVTEIEDDVRLSNTSLQNNENKNDNTTELDYEKVKGKNMKINEKEKEEEMEQVISSSDSSYTSDRLIASIKKKEKSKFDMSTDDDSKEISERRLHPNKKFILPLNDDSEYDTSVSEKGDKNEKKRKIFGFESVSESETITTDNNQKHSHSEVLATNEPVQKEFSWNNLEKITKETKPTSNSSSSVNISDKTDGNKQVVDHDTKENSHLSHKTKSMDSTHNEISSSSVHFGKNSPDQNSVPLSFDNNVVDHKEIKNTENFDKKIENNNNISMKASQSSLDETKADGTTSDNELLDVSIKKSDPTKDDKSSESSTENSEKMNKSHISKNNNVYDDKIQKNSSNGVEISKDLFREKVKEDESVSSNSENKFSNDEDKHKDTPESSFADSHSTDIKNNMIRERNLINSIQKEPKQRSHSSVSSSEVCSSSSALSEDSAASSANKSVKKVTSDTAILNNESTGTKIDSPKDDEEDVSSNSYEKLKNEEKLDLRGEIIPKTKDAIAIEHKADALASERSSLDSHTEGDVPIKIEDNLEEKYFDENKNDELQNNIEKEFDIYFENDEITFKKAKDMFEEFNDRKVSSLTIKDCELPSYIFNFISNKLESKKDLKKIELTNCEVEISLLKLLAKALDKWPLLEAIIISNNIFVDFSLFDLIKSLERVYNDDKVSDRLALKLFDISNSALQENDFGQIIKMIADNTNIENIVLDRNPINRSLWQNLREALVKNSNAKSISIRNCVTDADLLTEISEDSFADINARLIIS